MWSWYTAIAMDKYLFHFYSWAQIKWSAYRLVIFVISSVCVISVNSLYQKNAEIEVATINLCNIVFLSDLSKNSLLTSLRQNFSILSLWLMFLMATFSTHRIWTGDLRGGLCGNAMQLSPFDIKQHCFVYLL